MRPWLAYAIAIVAGLLILIGVTALIGNHDKSGQTVPASAWAETVCGTIGTWRGEMEAVVGQIRNPPSRGSLGVAEPQSQTPQSRTQLIRTGLESGVRATKTLVEGIENAGTPDTPQGQQAAAKVSDWASSSRDQLEQAQDSLNHEASTLEAALANIGGAVRAMGTALTTGVRTIGGVAAADPQLAAALRDSSTCQQLREEEIST
jgi:hypothetical protein